MERVRSLARMARRSTSSRFSPAAAAAPATLNTVRSPAIPRRLCLSAGFALKISSVTTTVRQSMPSARTASCAELKCITSPA
jgi:hypothetical protein